MNSSSRNNMKPKSQSILNLIRYKNIAPTALLTFSGAWITNPSMQSMLTSPMFLTALTSTICIMSASMAINDIYDIDIDKTNNPLRPLVTGELTIKEAKIVTAVLLGVTEYISCVYLPEHLRHIVHIAILDIVFYTKYLKPVLFLKNVSCASIVAFAVYFGGLSNMMISNPINMALLQMATQMVFFGSLHNELLLDIYDETGDRLNQINTVPVVYGIQNTWTIVYIFTNLNILLNMYQMTQLFDLSKGVFLFIVYIPFLYNLINVKRYNYSKEMAKYAVNESTKPMLFILLYLCWLTTI